MAMPGLNQSFPAKVITYGGAANAKHRSGPRVSVHIHVRCATQEPETMARREAQFHTFNKRVMVYDERSNFVGDTHWRKDLDFDEGEELQLERGGILVEVRECVGRRDQDISENKRAKERLERVAAKNSGSPLRLQASVNKPQTPAETALRQKSLNDVLGKPTGHYGKAVVQNLSPFEQRQQSNRDERDSGRPAKKGARAKSTRAHQARAAAMRRTSWEPS